MLYLLDANVLIDANRDYYPLGRVPEFWDWLVYCGARYRTKIPVEMYEEILAKDDDLTDWLKDNRKDSDRYKLANFIGVAVCNSIPHETRRGPARLRPSPPWSP